MFETILTKFSAFIDALPFSSATWFVVFTLGFFVWLFARATQRPRNLVKWEHLIIDSDNNRASPYKVGYVVGVIVGTWIVISLSDNHHLDFDIFGAYLTFLLGGAGVNSFARVKPGYIPPQPPIPNDPVDPDDKLQ